MVLESKFFYCQCASCDYARFSLVCERPIRKFNRLEVRKSSAISSLLSSQSGCSELLLVLIYCLNFLLFCRLQLHKLMDHSFQSVEHDIIAEDKHLQSPFLLIQQHGLTGCARHVVDVGDDHAGKRLTIHNEVHIDGLAAALWHRLHNGLLDGRKRRFDVRSALLVAQHGKKLSVRRDDRTARKRWDLVIHRRIAV